jgi:hypothetical protein
MHGYKRGKGRKIKGVRDKGKERKREENGREMFISFVWFLREEKRKNGILSLFACTTCTRV